jgi:alpha-beta hydrolase superfamily lysophospholipase
MNAVSVPLIDELQGATAGAAAEPQYFPSGNYNLFGWLHWPGKEATANVGVVICKPFGFESMSGHLSLRTFAETAAELGIPTMRFDYVGTGDSDDLDPGADQIDAWVRDVVAAVNELQRRTGVERVCLLGFRLGALLAALAAPQCKCVSALIAVAPIINGGRYLRELRTFELAAARFAAAQEDVAAAPAGRSPRTAAAGGSRELEVSGFRLSPATVTTLSQLDLMSRAAPPVSALLVIDRDDQPAARAWTDVLSAAGVNTEYLTLSGFVLMMMKPPNLTVIPRAMIAAVREWLARFQLAVGRREAGRVQHRNQGLETPSSVLPLRGEAAMVPTERPLVIASDPLLFGIVTEPPKDEVRRGGVILLNSGGDHHIGPRRMYVSLARRWARQGYVVLRMDLAGLGDSGVRPGREVNETFPPHAIDDVRAAVECLRSRFGVAEVTLGGMCSGAYHALQAAVEGLPVKQILMVNPLTFFWEEGMNEEDVQPWEVVHKPAAYLGRALSMDSWKRLLTGDVSIWRVLKIYLIRPWLAVQSSVRDLARHLHIRLKNDIGWELQQLAARGIRIVFVFSRGDAGISLLELQSGLSVKKLSKLYRVRTIEGADHDFTRSVSRAALEDVLSEELTASRP